MLIGKCGVFLLLLWYMVANSVGKWILWSCSFSVDIHSLLSIIESYWEELCGCLDLSPCNWLKILTLWKSVFILENCNFTRMSQFWWFCYFSLEHQIFLYFKEVSFHHGFEHLLFCCLLREYLLSVCWVCVFKPSYLSSSLFAFIYLSFSSAFCAVFWRLFSISSTLFLVCGFCLLLL